MALINCPECSREVSDTVLQCPHCGYAFNKKSKKKNSKIALMIFCVVLMIAITLGVLYFFVLQPNQLLQQAATLVERGRYGEAEVILAQLKDSDEKTSLQVKITLAEVNADIMSGNYDEANRKLTLIPEDKIDSETKILLTTHQAETLMVKGRYDEADALLSEIEQTDEIIAFREELSYESRVYSCIKSIKKVLKNPDSLSVYEIGFYPDQTIDPEASTEDIPVYVDTEPSCVMHYGAQNGFGGNTTGYAVFTCEDEEYNLYATCDSLELEDLDKDDDDYLYELLAQIKIIGLMTKDTVGSFDMERVQTLLKNNNYSAVKLIK